MGMRLPALLPALLLLLSNTACLASQRHLLHAGHSSAAADTTAAGSSPDQLQTTSAQALPTDGSTDPMQQPQGNINWIKAVAAVVLFFEAMLGVSIPLLRRVNWVKSAFQRGLMSILNAFAGGVFLTFGIMHLFGHVTDAQADSGYTAYFPIGVFFITLGFMVFLFLQRVLSPLLTPAGAQGTSCCAAAVPLEGAARKEGIEEGTAANGKECPCDQSTACRAPPAQRAWVAFISPCLLLFAMCIHGIFEGLALGIQYYISPFLLLFGACIHGILEGLTLGIQDDRGAVITVLVALVAHKWVESLALSARCLKIGANWWQTATFLLPFALTAPLGVGIGAALTDVNAWAQMVLYAFATGFFLYVGASEVIGEEFAYGNSHSKRFRAVLFLAAMVGFTLVALLQLIHDGD